MRITIAVIACLLISLNLSAQGKPDDKYLQALLYLKTNKEVNSVVKETYAYKVDKKKETIDFDVLDEIWFIPIFPFRYELKQENYFGLDSSIINSSTSFYKQYYFEPLKLNYLNKVLPFSGFPLTVTFSKPIGRILLAEMLDNRLGATNNAKLGKGLGFLFVFSDDGYIEKVYTSVGTYR